MTYLPNAVDATKREKALQTLEYYVKEDYALFIDTCSLLHDSSEKFWEHLIPLLER